MKSYNTIITAAEAFERLDDADVAFVDCRFSLKDPDLGFRDYQAAHIKGAVYADLNKDLSSPVIPGRTGRHPLPEKAALVETLSRLGIDTKCQVVCYDESSGAMAAARLWWLVQWAGHPAAAVLDGGFRKWAGDGYPTSTGMEYRSRRTYTSNFRDDFIVDGDQVLVLTKDPTFAIVDSRSADRYKGENETIDPVAGHIPNALNAPFADNSTESGQFKSPSSLRERFDALVGSSRPTDKVIFYCGSGVTAAHNVLSFARAGKSMPKLYAGSWSDWITDPNRPVITGKSKA